MDRITLYLFRSLVQAMVFVTFAITAAIWLTRSLRYIDIVVENGAPLHMFVWLALLTLPTFMGLVLPIAVFVAVLFTYNRLTNDSELIAMRACGMSPRSLARPALYLAGSMTIATFALSLWIQPAALRELTRLQYFVQSQFSAALLREGTFNDLGNKMTIYVSAREDGGRLRGLLIYDARDAQKPITIRADKGQLVEGTAGPQVIIERGIQQQYDRRTARLSELTFDTYALSLNSLIKDKSDRATPPRELSTVQLVSEIGKVTDKKTKGRLYAELNQRFTAPWLALSFSLLALVALLIGDYSRRGQTARIFAAVVGTAGLQAASLALTQAVSKSLWLTVPLYAVTFIPIIILLRILFRGQMIPLYLMKRPPRALTTGGPTS